MTLRASPLLASVVAILGVPGAAGAEVATSSAAPAGAETATVGCAVRADAALEAFVDGVVRAYQREHDIPGITVGLVRDGAVWTKGYGVADLETGRPVDGDATLFRIGSISKTFVWTAAMMLWERDQLDLDGDVNADLRAVVVPEAFGAPVTLNDLMAHRAGFEDALAVFTHRDDAPLSLAEALTADMPARVFAPGERTSYSNWGSALAAQVVEDVAGVPYSRFLRDELLAPLGMDATTLRGPDLMTPEQRARLATGYAFPGGRPAPADPMQIGPYAPIGAMAATAADMVRWMQLHLGRGTFEGARLMSPETHARMWTRHFRDRPAAPDVAHGFMTKRYRGHTAFGHGGGTTAFVSFMQIVPDLGLGVFVSQNMAGDQSLTSALSDLITEHLVGAATATAAVPRSAAAAVGPPEAAALRDYAGTYLNNRRSFTRFEKLFAVTSALSVDADGDAGIWIASPMRSRRFVPVDAAPDTFEDREGNRVFFGRDDRGRVAYMSGWSGVHTFERVGLLDDPKSLNVSLGVALLLGITTWLGALVRWRRRDPAPLLSRALGALALLAATGQIVLVGMVAWLTVTLASATATDMLNYPTPAVVALRGTAQVLFGIGIAMLLAVLPAWKATRWPRLRKLHFTLFALALAVFVAFAVRWNVVFAPFA
jgi:CubicO group peptidase (beta-lactamase class C family)